MTTEKFWLSRKEICLASSISLSTLNRMIKAGIIKSPHITYVGRRVLISAEALKELHSIMDGRARSLIKEVKINAG